VPSLPEKSVSGYFSKCLFSSLWDAALLQERGVFFRGRKFEFVWISMNFQLEKSLFPRDRDVEGGHTGCQDHIPQSGSEFSFACCASKNLFVFDV